VGVSRGYFSDQQAQVRALPVKLKTENCELDSAARTAPRGHRSLPLGNVLRRGAGPHRPDQFAFVLRREFHHDDTEATSMDIVAGPPSRVTMVNLFTA
jgi:hypothetical protein